MKNIDYIANKINMLTAGAEYEADEAGIKLKSIKEYANIIYNANENEYKWDNAQTELNNIKTSLKQKKTQYIYAYINYITQKLPWFEDTQEEENCTTAKEIKSMLNTELN